MSSEFKEIATPVLPEHLRVVKLDFDDREEEPMTDELTWRLNRAGYGAIVSSNVRRSPSGTGWHMELVLEPSPQTALEVVALQAILGSDPRREACNLHRAKMLATMPSWAWDSWNVLYKGWR